MSSDRSDATFRRLILAACAVALALGTWLYVDLILGPHQVAEAQRTGMPMGYVSDMFGPWAGARALFRDHRNPYGQEVTEAIQRNSYGRPLDPNDPREPRDLQRMVYPLPMLLLVAPAAALDFDTLRPINDFLLVLMTIASVPLWMMALGIRTDGWTTRIAIILTLGSWPVVQALHLEQPALLVCFLLAAASALAARGRLGWAGVLLALSIAKPQVSAPVIGWLALWTVLDWRHRRPLLISFTAGCALLLSVSEALQPQWWRYWWANVQAAKQYMNAHTILTTLAGPYAGPVLTFLMLAAIIVLFWRLGRYPASSPAFALCLAGAAIAGLFVSPQWLSYSQLVLVPTVLWLYFIAVPQTLPGRTAHTLAAAVIMWPWLGSWVLLITAALSRPRAEQWWWLPLVTVMYVPLVVGGAFAFHARESLRQPCAPKVRAMEEAVSAK